MHIKYPKTYILLVLEQTDKEQNKTKKKEILINQFLLEISIAFSVCNKPLNS